MSAPERAEERSLVPPALADDAHKGDAGRVLCLCGSREMPGAAILVVRAALRGGAGLVTGACLDPALLTLLPQAAPEALLLEVERPERIHLLVGQRKDDAMACGPGLGQGERARGLVHALLGANVDCPLVLDADALNLLAGEVERVRTYPGPLILTPHPGEAARLLGREVPRDEAGRIAAARELAGRSGAVVVLKGRRTVVTHGELLYVNATGNPGMATGGAGDVLTGILAAYAALCHVGQHPEWTPFDAAASAVRVHGLAGDLAAAHTGMRGLIASDLIAWLAPAQRRLEAGQG